MLNTTDKIIKHKTGLFNLADELSNVSKTCQVAVEAVAQYGASIRKPAEHSGQRKLLSLRAQAGR